MVPGQSAQSASGLDTHRRIVPVICSRSTAEVPARSQPQPLDIDKSRCTKYIGGATQTKQDQQGSKLIGLHLTGTRSSCFGVVIQQSQRLDLNSGEKPTDSNINFSLALRCGQPRIITQHVGISGHPRSGGPLQDNMEGTHYRGRAPVEGKGVLCSYIGMTTGLATRPRGHVLQPLKCIPLPTRVEL